MANIANITTLNTVLGANAHRLAYINLNTTTTPASYSGWISNFHIYKLSDQGHTAPIYLNLNLDNDLFLLFVLASCWSRTGQFENATYFTVYLKEKGYDNPSLWLSSTFVNSEKAHKDLSVREILSIYEDIRLPGRKEIAFRSDFYDGVVVLAEKWNDIKQSLTFRMFRIDTILF